MAAMAVVLGREARDLSGVQSFWVSGLGGIWAQGFGVSIRFGVCRNSCKEFGIQDVDYTMLYRTT